MRRLAEERIGVAAPLHDYQWDGVSFLHRSSSALLADEMGLGKTVQTSIALALLLDAPNDIQRALIVAPASLTLNWMSELATWAPSITVRRLQGDVSDREACYLLPIPVLVGSYEQIRTDGLDRIPRDTFDLVVLDEAQRIKDRNTTTSLACRLLPRKRSWALSATPLENRLEDIATILDFLGPTCPSDTTRNEILRRLELGMLRRRKRDVRGELPPVIIQDMQLELSPQQRKQYDNLWSTRDTILGGWEHNNTSTMLGLITKLKGICNYDVETGVSTKYDALKTVIDAACETAKIIVFSQFVKSLE